jgi:hypothetical protein
MVAFTQTVGATVALLDMPTFTAALPGETAPLTAKDAPAVTLAGSVAMLMVAGMIEKLLDTPITAGLA